MSCNRYNLIQEKDRIIHSDARLLYLSTAKYGGDWHSLPHTHDCTELFLVTGGSGQFSIENELYPVHVGDLFIINPNVEHTETSLNAQPLEYIVLGVEIFSSSSKMNRMTVFVSFTFRIIWKIFFSVFIPCKEKSKQNRSVMKWSARIFWISWLSSSCGKQNFLLLWFH